ncbi:PD-(D/E)XK nuclease family protein [Metabacillus schmidteae]|uniref:PD-(D/E)XK nuclease family protein n=1 Tax=Metabacillus schmidteae TaxID=2730405 RepID=UPI00158B7C16|nr:PD-(D/E)XK nuclease family protein [Metabacillus schmidteae]
MNSLMKELVTINTKFPYQEKIILVDSYTVGAHILEAFTDLGHRAINVTFKTVTDLAEELIELHHPNQKEVVTDTIGSQFVYTILSQLKENHSLTYFKNMEITSSFSRAMYQILHTLRMAGYTSDTLNTDDFLTADKGKDMKLLLSQYENSLHTYQMTDHAETLRLATQYAIKTANRVYILQSNLSLSQLEEEFLYTLLPDHTYKLPLQKVLGVKVSERSNLRSIVWGEPTPLSYLYDLEHKVETENVTLFTAKTEEVEIKQILHKIKESQAKLDKHVVYYTNREPYVTHFYHLSQKTELPITFGQGLPVLTTRPGRLIAGILQWTSSNYSVNVFLDLIHEGLLHLEEDMPSGVKMTRILRDASIGWDKKRYISQLTEEINRLELKQNEATDELKAEYYQEKMNQLITIQKWFVKLFKNLPDYKNELNYRECLQAIAYVLKHYCRTSSAADQVAKTELLEEIEKLLPYCDETLTRFKVFEKMKDLLLSINVLKSSAKPGHLHVTSYERGIYEARHFAYIVGLDSRKFPGSVNENPLLLDTERNRLGKGLNVNEHKSQENLYHLVQLLAQQEGHVSLSYCNFAVTDNRVVHPAHVFLQAYRMTSGHHDADFKDVAKLPSSYVAEELINEQDYWAQKVITDQKVKVKSDVLSHFYHLESGIKAMNAREEMMFTEFDGKITIDQAMFDPRINQERSMTAGRLETLAKCPYSYFLSEVLGVRPIEEVAFNPNKWLDAATRGSLLHSVFETFYKTLQSSEAKPSFIHHEETILAIANEHIQVQRDISPPPNERVYELELADIIECCRIFLKEEEQHCESYNPLHFEYTFGVGEFEAAEITLPSGQSMKIAGKIDRVDETSSGTYHIVDYKTGSTYGYSTNGMFKGGRQLQHFVYALAIEQHLQLKTGAVEESAYYFPTVKGLAQRFVRKQDETVRAQGLTLLENLIELVSQGIFTMTDDENDCKFCNYKSVCKRHFYDEETLSAKRSDKTYEPLRQFLGVRAHD